jgi:K+-sensing histidine kinase KdpD
MISAAREEELATDSEYQNLLADLFHALSQPLTTLQCCLTGSLQKPASAGRYRRDLQMALQQAKAVVFLTAAIRELVACEAGTGQPHLSDLSACVREVVGDLLPIANSTDLALNLTCRASCMVNLEAGRLRQAAFCLVESALNHARPGSAISIRVSQTTEIRLTLNIFAPSGKITACRKTGGTNITGLNQRLTLAIARRTFESAGGTFQIRRRLRQTTLSIRLPLSHREPALPLVPSSQRCG